MPIITPYVPSYIVVHLGTPNSSAQNVTVSFPDYIKNVASSEIYPTWNESAIYANIYAQISFALNRVYLEHYPSQGYSFNITNSTAYDQAFTPGRNIFENIDRIVDDIFNDYIRRMGYAEPLAAIYCNGTTATCNGLSQWGSEELASQGYSSINILKYYYGYNIELVQEAPVMGLRSSYPGYPLQRGSVGDYVVIVQRSLSRISQNYPAIPNIYPIDGIFGESTERSVIAFQEIFNLTPDGIVGKSTWYRLVYLYTAVNKLGELESEGQRLFGINLTYPDAITEGNRGEKVYILQYFLSVLAQFYDYIPFIEIDGIFGPKTKNAVIAFQKSKDLPQTGEVDDVTWNEIYREFRGIVTTVFEGNVVPKTFIPFSGTTLRLGSKGEEVTTLQQYINNIATIYPEISPVEVTGVYDEATMNSVMQYQKKFGLRVTGNVDRITWNSIGGTYLDIVSSENPQPTQYPGYELNVGQSDFDSNNKN